jgi:hypothetical protein
MPNNFEQFDSLRKSTNLGTRRFVEMIEDLLRGNRPRTPRRSRSIFAVAEIYGWKAVLDAAHDVAKRHLR